MQNLALAVHRFIGQLGRGGRGLVGGAVMRSLRVRFVLVGYPEDDTKDHDQQGARHAAPTGEELAVPTVALD